MGMIPSTKQLLNIILKVREMHPEWTISELAQQLGYSPLFIINALELGDAEGALKWDREGDTFEAEPLDVSLVFEPYGTEVSRLADEIAAIVATRNAGEDDIEEGMLYRWLSNVRPIFVELALDKLVAREHIAKYDLTDPKDKESVYTFVTLAENEPNHFGAKQFKVQPKVDTKE